MISVSNIHWSRKAEKSLLIGSGALFCVGVFFECFFLQTPYAPLFYIAAAALGLLFVAPSVIKACIKRTADINTLMGIAVLGALIMGFYKISYGEVDVELFRDAAIVIFLYQIGEALEDWSYEKTQTSIETLMNLAPELAHVVQGSMRDRAAASCASLPLKDEKLDEVGLDCVVKVLPGERVPLDGTIVEGTSAFNEAPVTGESIPQDKGSGEKVYGGSLNTSAPVFVRVEARSDGGMLARIVNMVETAQKQKAPYESFISRFAAVYTPIVVIVALVVAFLVPALLTVLDTFVAPGTALQLSTLTGATAGVAATPASNIWMVWIARALTLLVISCPCALVISTPVSFVSAITCAARFGVLVKGGSCFDSASRLNIIAFDKTGTLTKGEPHVIDVHTFRRSDTPHEKPRFPKPDLTKEQIVALAFALEENSTHPLARAVVAYAAHPTITFALSDLSEVTGNGMKATLSGECVALGKPQFIQELLKLTKLPTTIQKTVEGITAKGATCLLLSQGPTIVGALGIADTPRETSITALNELRKSFHLKTVMLTGDNDVAAREVARSMGIDEVAANLLPHDKVSSIEALKEGGSVAFVGDGINDAPALAAADLGISVGAAASDTALEVASVALLAGDLEKLPTFFGLARRTMAVVKENIAFALIVKIGVLILALCGFVGMGWAIFADTGVTLIVALNGMRLMLGLKTRF